MNRNRPSQRGFAVIAAIFLVVLLAALGAFMLGFANAQQITSAQDLQGSRAYWAARGGLEWGIASTMAACPASPTTLAIDGFAVAITCTSGTYAEAGATPRIFQFTSVASSAAAVGSIAYVERSLSASIEK